jgi:radical SAM superfamily enzyme YgiQ (UPF0313 family)
MRILLADNLLLEHGGWSHHFDLQPHLGLISLIAVAEAAGHEGILFDPKLSLARHELELGRSLYRDLAVAMLGHKPDVVGLTSLGCNFICTLKVAAYIKELAPQIPILLGGPHATILHRQIVDRFPQFDVVVRNEAEETLAPLLDGLIRDRPEDAPGVTLRRGTKIVETAGSPLIADLDTLPWPAYDHYPIGELGLRSIRVEAGRGCPFDCTFCSTASFFGRRYRLKSATRLVAELDYLHQQYGISQFALMHDLFTVSKAKVREFCEAVVDRGYEWRCSARMDCVDAGLLEQMWAAGCRSIYYGVETGSPRMQLRVSKHLDLALYEPTLDRTVALGMRPTASFITGYPDESLEDQNQTLNLIGDSIRRYPDSLTIQLHLLTPEPGTTLMIEHAAELEYDGHISDFNFPTLEPDDAEIMAKFREVFVNHHFYRGALARRRHVVVTSAYLHLYRLGFPVLRRMLVDFGGSFSQIFETIFAWIEANHPGRLPDADLLTEFIAARWGSEHVISSLARYMFQVTDPSWRDGPPIPVARRAAPQRQVRSFVVAPRVAVLRNIHDCAEILRLIRTAATSDDPIPTTLLEDRADFLVFRPERRPAIARNFRLNEASALLLDFFASPRTESEFFARFGSPPFDRVASEAAFRFLREEGIVEAVRVPVRPPFTSRRANGVAARREQSLVSATR